VVGFTPSACWRASGGAGGKPALLEGLEVLILFVSMICRPFGVLYCSSVSPRRMESDWLKGGNGTTGGRTRNGAQRVPNG